jgi:restriction endonuclease S subunit
MSSIERSRGLCANKTIANSDKLVYSRSMSTKIKLGKIAEIQSGYSFRGAVKDEGRGTAVVQARDITSLYVSSDALPQVKQPLSDGRLLRDGDVLLTSRGSFRAGVARLNAVPTVASSSLYVLRVTDESILPEFLALYLNSPTAQTYFKQNAKGATIQSVSVSDIAAFAIPIMPLNQQRLLVDLQQNVEQQGMLLRSKLGFIEGIYSSAINSSLKGVA